MATFEPSVLLTQLHTISASPGTRAALTPDMRVALSVAAREASYKLETPTDTLARLLLCQPVEAVCVRIAADLKLFEVLFRNRHPQSLETLARVTRSDPDFLTRLLRCLVAVYAVQQHDSGLFSIGPNFVPLARRELAESWGPCNDFLGNIYRNFPLHLAEKGYQNPTDSNNTVVQQACNAPNMHFMDILFRHPRELQGFATIMNIWDDGFTSLLDVYPVEAKLINGFSMSESDVMFVDVGGGFGQKAIALRREFPQLPGRVIVQDLPVVLENAPVNNGNYDGIELMPYDFTTRQPIRNARCYYMRQCLRHWDDDKVLLILKNLRDAMKQGYSTLLVHEIIVPERGAGTWVTTQDMELMGIFGTRERTRHQWDELFTQAGLKYSGYFVNDHPTCEGILEVYR